MTNHIRHRHGCVRPYLHGPVELVEFLKQVFTALEVERFEFGPQSFHVELRVGDSAIVLEAGDLPPEVRPWTGAVYVYVPDVDAVYQTAIDLGAESIASPTAKPYGERQCGFRDSGGNTWWVGTFTG